MFQFIHAADIHLDSPLRGLSKYEGAPVDQIRNATRRALSNLIDLAIEKSVAFVLISGDLYDGDWQDYNTGLFFVNQVRRLRDAEIPLLLISGNHDAANKMTMELTLPENVSFLSAQRPETIRLPGLDVAVHGQSFAKSAVYEDLSEAYPAADSGLFNLGMLHTSATGREGHEPYAPCSIESLKLKGYDYWALGHIHQREVLSEDPFIAFSGNIQGRHIRETGPKGCLLVTVQDDHRVESEFQALDVLRWERVNVDVTESQGIDDVLQRVNQELERNRDESDGRPLAVRVALVGESAVDRELSADRHRWINEIRSISLDVGQGAIWIEKVQFRTSSPRLTSGHQEVPDDAIGEIRSLFAQIRDQPDRMANWGLDLSDVIKKLPAELRSLVREDDPEWLAEVTAASESLLLSRLLEKEEER